MRWVELLKCPPQKSCAKGLCTAENPYLSDFTDVSSLDTGAFRSLGKRDAMVILKVIFEFLN